MHLLRLAPRLAALAFLIVGAVRCSRSTEANAAPAAAVVRFAYVNPTCAGTVLTFQFSIDHNIVGIESFRDGQTSRAYPTAPGVHVIGATFPTAGRSVVADTTVVLAAGQTFTREMFVYCS